MNGNNNNKPSKAQRKAQSQRDKQANQAKGLGQQKKQPKQRAPRKQKQQSAAAAYATGQTGKAPAIKMSRDTCRVVHRELIASVTGSTAFTVAQSFALNPGIAATFPWLAIMAQSWEQYRFRSLKFCYYTRTGSNIPGSVILAPDYDAADAAPVSEQVASAFEDVAEDAPWKDIECVLRSLSMDGGMSRHFTRSTALAANQDIKTFDVGNLHLCTIDGTAVGWGKLWVEYDVEFFVPQLPPTGQLAFVGGSFSSNGGTTAANPIGTAPIPSSRNAGISMSAASVLTFGSAGTFVVGVDYQGTVITGVTNPVFGAGAAQNNASVSIKAAATSATAWYTVVVTNPATATMAFALTATTVTASTVVVGAAPSGSA